MYICICKAVTEGQIRQAAADGVTQIGELCRCLGVAQGCGQCVFRARAVLEESVGKPVPCQAQDVAAAM